MPITNTTYAFPIDGEFRRIHRGPILANWQKAAHAKGFTIVGRAVSHEHLVLGCKTCGSPTLKRVSVVRDHNPECPHCIRTRRENAAAGYGATLLGPDPKGKRHYGLYELPCGHTDRRQHKRVETAAAGGHKLGCGVCLKARHAAEAEAQGWQLIGKAERKDVGYRRYEHECGHLQDVTIANMRHGDVDCAGCGESWTCKPSKIYLLRFNLPEFPVTKLGYSNNPEFRMRQVQYDPLVTQGAVIRDIPVPTGHQAVRIEKALHSFIAASWPDLLVPPDNFEPHLRTISEIYDRRAEAFVSDLFDAVVAGWDPSSGTPPF
ncbi:hypothetical protein [uncultured Sulfitobacter sp.]|uniref:hypothetical protein n=1 Tax=uncultured Sulfitobacter sp. TaxID=191468 RepID=UPI0030DCA262